MNVTRTVYAPSCSSWAWDPDVLPSTIDNRLRLAEDFIIIAIILILERDTLQKQRKRPNAQLYFQ